MHVDACILFRLSIRHSVCMLMILCDYVYMILYTRWVLLLCYRLYKQGMWQPDYHNSTEPMRNASSAIEYVTVERVSNYIKVPRDMQPLNNRVLET